MFRTLARPLTAVVVGVALFAGLPAVSASAAEAPGLSAGIPTPSATTTGVPTWTALKVYQGDLKITTPGTIIDGLDVRGVIFVQAADVTIKNTIVRGRTVTANTGLINAQFPEVKNLLVDNVELAPTTPDVHLTGIYGHDMQIRESNIHDVVDGIHLVGDNVKVYRNYVHDLSYFLVDPAQNGGPTHNDDIQLQKGANVWISNNVLTGAGNSALQVTQDTGTVSNLTVNNNLIDGGGCTLNIAQKARGAITGLTITSNRFGASQYNCNIIISKPTRAIASITNNSRIDGKAVRVNDAP